jgi:hypothetical protein
MIDLKGIAAYDTGFTQNSGANRKKDNTGHEFSLQNGETGSSSGTKEIRDVELKSTAVKKTGPETEVETYDFWGKVLSTKIPSGVNVDIVI